MTLVLELSPEAESRLRENAARAGHDVESFVLEAALQKGVGTYSLDEAAQVLRLARGALLQKAQEGELSTQQTDGVQVFLHDAKFEALLQSGRETEEALREIGAQNQALGLYDE